MTQFGFEVPIAHLEDFEDLQDFHFLLSIHCNNPTYRQFYYNQVTTNDKEIWLDNSWNETEKADHPLLLCKYFHQYCASKVIAPDDINWGKVRLAEAFTYTAKLVSTDRIIVVIKDEQEEDYLRQVGAKHFAVPFRYRLTKTYDELKWCKSFHFLGMNHINELKELAPPTMDTSMPIRAAINNLSLSAWIKLNCPRYWHKDMKDYYDMKLDTKTIELARANIIQLKEMVNE